MKNMIREATLEDLPSITSIMELNSDVYSKNEISAAKEDIKEWTGVQNRKDNNYFVEVNPHKITGCAGYSKRYDTEGVYTFSWLAVHPDFKRKGVATDLYNLIEAQLTKLNARLIILNTGKGEVNNFFYEKIGFKIGGIIPTYYHGKNDLVWYYKSLIP